MSFQSAMENRLLVTASVQSPSHATLSELSSRIGRGELAEDGGGSDLLWKGKLLSSKVYCQGRTVVSALKNQI